MAKRIRSLASLLWEDEEPDNLLAEWTLKSAPVLCESLKSNGNSVRNFITAVETQPQEDLEKLPAVPAQMLAVSKPSLKRRRREDPWYWLQDLPEALRNLHRMQSEVLRDLESSAFASGAISFDIPSNGNLASGVLQHAELTIRCLSSKHPALHKIGITSNPVKRWEHTEYGYKYDKQPWDKMTVVHIHHDAHAICLLEAALIRIFLGTPGCRNIRPGGEGVHCEATGPFFCYIVHRLLVPPKAK